MPGRPATFGGQQARSSVTSALAGVLQLLKYEALETIVHIEVARNSHVGDKADVDLVSRVVFLLNEVRGLMQK